MARKLKSDKPLFYATLLLLGASLVMVYSGSAVLAPDGGTAAEVYLFRQFLWLMLGSAVLAIAMRIDYRIFKHPAVVCTALAVTGAALVAVLFGREVGGANRWFAVAGVGIQPSELAKIAVIIFTAMLLERRLERIDDPIYALFPIGMVTAIAAGLILLQPDYGTALTVIAIVSAMVYTAGISYRYVVTGFLILAPTLFLVLAWEPYRWRRIMAFLDPWEDPLGAGWQTIQSLIAVGSGGVFGQGLMAGVQKLNYLPEPHTDFIFAVIAEETGLIGTTLTLVCFAVITWRGLRISRYAPDRFGALLALGLTTMLALQAYINMSVVLALLPTKGIPLPFVSAGGSSLLICLLGMGILLNISQYASAET